MNKTLRFSLLSMLMMLCGSVWAQSWEKTNTLSVGDVVVLAADNGTATKELSGVTTSGTTIGQVENYNGTPAGLYPLTIVAGSAEGSIAFKTSVGTYLSWSSGNSLTTNEEVAEASSWIVNIDENGKASIANVKTPSRKLQYNAGSPRFACYTSSQTEPIFWKQVAGNVLAKPVLTPSSSFLETMTVEITASDDATIYYTTDGTVPTTESTEYEQPFTITETTTVKAIAVVSSITSGIAEETYTKLNIITLAQAQAEEKGTTVAVEGKIVASAANGAVLSDGTDYLYYYNNANALIVGQKVRMVGELGEYGGAKQLTSTATITELGTEEVTHPAATELTGEDMDAIYSEKVAERKYVSFVGSLSISGNYYNITVDGAETAIGSIVKPNEDLSFLNGQTVKVTGYLMYVNNKYVYAVATNVEEVLPEGTITVDGKNYQITGENIIKNGSFDDGVSGWYAGAWAEANASNYTLVPEGGFDGGAYLQYSAGGVSSEKNIRGKWNVEIGKMYLFRCYTSGKTPDSNNLQYSVLRIYDESKDNYEGNVLYQLKWGVAAGQSTDTWTENSFVFTATSNAVTFRSSWTTNARLDGFQLYELTPYYSATSFRNTLVAAQSALANEEYAAVTGEERTALSDAIETYKNATSEDYEKAINALDAAKNAFVKAKSAYDELANVNAMIVDLPYALADKKPEAKTATNAEAATTTANDIIIALRAYYESNALAEGVETAANLTSSISNPAAENGTNGWTLTKSDGANIDVKTGEPWTDSEGNSSHKYFDGGNWGANSWDVTFSQDITLNKGKYLLTAITRASTQVEQTLFAGENKVTTKVIGSTGGVFDRGWNDHSVEFEVADDETPVTIGVRGATNAVHEWMSFANFRLVKLDADLTAIKEAALDEIDDLPAGTKLFYYDTEKINAAKNAVNTAEDKAAIDAAVAEAKAAQNLPVADEEYCILNKAANSLMLNVADNSVNIAKFATIHIIGVEGGWVISNADKSAYIFKTTDNNWTLSTTTTKEDAYVVNFNIVDGGYTIQGAKGLFGTDSTDEGSAVYADKNLQKNGLWDLVTKTEGEVTGIKTVKAETAQKGIFNLNGQKVMKAQKGLYILNGKKVVVK